MKIDTTGSARATAPARRGERGPVARTGEFARHLDSAPAATAVSSGNPIGAVNTILSLQEVDDPLTGRSRATARASEILDGLDELREGLLAGTMSRQSLINLAGLVRLRRPNVTDPKLKEVLDEIELRAEVELAKFDGRLGER
jgi:hypothetical protein